jgi:toxin ParE1/3/4
MIESVVWRPEALADIARIIAYVAERNPVAAYRIAQELVLAGDSLTLFPRRGHRGRVSGTRELAATRPYILVYEVNNDDTVTILRVWHGAQNRDG